MSLAAAKIASDQAEPRTSISTESIKVHTRIKVNTPGGIAWTSDGQTLAVYSRLGTRIEVFNIDGSKLTELRRDTTGSYLYAGNSIAFLSDRNLLVTPPAHDFPHDHDSALSIWDIGQSRPIKNVTGPFPEKGWQYNSADTFAVSSDGSVIASTSVFPNQPVTVYSTRDWSARFSIPVGGPMTESDCVQSLAISADGQMLAIGTCRGKVRVYSVVNEAQIMSMSVPRHDGQDVGVVSLAFSPDSRLLAGGIGATRTGRPMPDAIQIWRTDDGQSTSALTQAISPPIGPIAWSEDGRQIIFAVAKTIGFWP